MVAGSKGASLVLQNEATILLGKDVMQEKELPRLASYLFLHFGYVLGPGKCEELS